MSGLEKTTVFIIVAVWLASIALIAHEEGYFDFSRAVNTANIKSPPLLVPGKSLMGIYRKTRSGKTERVGQTITTTEILEDNSAIVTTRTKAELKLISYVPISFDSNMQVIFDPDGNLAQFSQNLSTDSTDALNIQVEGMRQDDRLHFSVLNKSTILYQDSFPMSHNLSIGSGLLPTGQFKDPEIFKSWPINYINPLTKKNESGKAVVNGNKVFLIGGKEYFTYKIDITFSDNTYLAPTVYITREGEMIELTGIAGYIFRKEPLKGESVD